jgi:antitoxin (DNA-binding transcriptional repressor) of toxin-antitoxin stability system
VITKHGRPYARLGPASQRKSQAEIEALMARVRQRREQLPMTTWSELKRDRDAGRRF